MEVLCCNSLDYLQTEVRNAFRLVGQGHCYKQNCITHHFKAQETRDCIDKHVYFIGFLLKVQAYMLDPQTKGYGMDFSLFFFPILSY